MPTSFTNDGLLALLTRLQAIDVEFPDVDEVLLDLDDVQI